VRPAQCEPGAWSVGWRGSSDDTHLHGEGKKDAVEGEARHFKTPSYTRHGTTA
jgi:hypothetical protein